MKFKFDILRSDWTPADKLHLVDCSRQGNVLHVGTAYIKRRINRPVVSVFDENKEYEFPLLLPEELQNSQSNTVELNTAFEILEG